MYIFLLLIFFFVNKKTTLSAFDCFVNMRFQPFSAMYISCDVYCDLTSKRSYIKCFDFHMQFYLIVTFDHFPQPR